MHSEQATKPSPLTGRVTEARKSEQRGAQNASLRKTERNVGKCNHKCAQKGHTHGPKKPPAVIELFLETNRRPKGQRVSKKERAFVASPFFPRPLDFSPRRSHLNRGQKAEEGKEVKKMPWYRRTTIKRNARRAYVQVDATHSRRYPFQAQTPWPAPSAFPFRSFSFLHARVLGTYNAVSLVGSTFLGKALGRPPRDASASLLPKIRCPSSCRRGSLRMLRKRPRCQT